jgi:nitroimidazol reductase NimA-like FMN-containing flavoprotein (pyridoxamine 5'-phosphate oxidase superfamily)
VILFFLPVYPVQNASVFPLHFPMIHTPSRTLDICQQTFYIAKKKSKGHEYMRRSHSEVSDPKEIVRILSLTNIGRLATIGQDGYPYITPVNFVSMNGNIYFHCAPKGEKLDNLKRNSSVCFEVDVPLAYIDIGLDPERPICHLHQLYHCVIIRGKAAIVKNGHTKVSALNALIAKHEKTEDFQKVTGEMSGYKACEVIEIKPDSISAKSDLIQNRSEEDRRAVAEYLFKRNHPGDRETAAAMGFEFKTK